ADLASLQMQADQYANSATVARQMLNKAVQHEAELALQLKTAEQQKQSADGQLADWQSRLAQTNRRLKEMKERKQSALIEKAQLERQPEAIEGKQQELMDRLVTAEAERLTRSDCLREAENALRQADTLLREAEKELSHKREALIRSEALCERYQSEQDSLIERIKDKLDCTPERLAELAQLRPSEQLPESLEKLELTVNRLLNERDQIGPVNLRAEVEMEEIDKRVTTLREEHEDLIEAIAKLRSAISSLNREGRSRLMESFSAVNKHFTQLFTTLFGGGHAELQLVNSDDPLQAGIEILASPPGKKMQALSLLSGGEQALTALAIIFAVFLTNPAPICVLDEVDAPLD
ncbi:MAG: chromosome partitioning protein ParA, partial [Gammaproteobacteria bacterium]|nr:chromosome partitioning protein ParA [Gammaproteobacteria bacterium]